MLVIIFPICTTLFFLQLLKQYYQIISSDFLAVMLLRTGTMWTLLRFSAGAETVDQYPDHVHHLLAVLDASLLYHVDARCERVHRRQGMNNTSAHLLT